MCIVGLAGYMADWSGYNRDILGYVRSKLLPYIVLLLAVFCGSCKLAESQTQALPRTRTLIVMPFENQSKAPGLEWISEAFAEVLSQRMASAHVYVISRDDRSYAFDHAGIPLTVRPSRATIYRVAEQMDADYVVLGSYDFDGNTFVASAQLLDMQKLHLGAVVQTKGALTDLITLQTGLAYDLLRQLPDPPSFTREQFLQASSPIRLDAFEDYIRGTLATDRQQKIRYFHAAIKLNPNYTLAILHLGKAYYDNHEYELASSWFARVPKNDPVAGEASFLLGMSEFYRGSFDKSFAAFYSLVGRLALTEVYNNLGVVESRRGKRASAVEYFLKATNADPNDPDYRFNLAVALYKNGDSAGAARQLKEVLQRRTADGEARSLLDNINRGVAAPPPLTASPSTVATAGNAMFPSSQVRVPMERIKRNYDEASYRQLEMEIHNLTEERLAQTDQLSHSAYHVERGKQLLAQNATAQAESEFREAVATDYNNAGAHAELASVLEKKGDLAGARSEAQIAIRLNPSVQAYLVLARVSLKQNQLEPAQAAVKKALLLEPSNQTALGVKQELAAKQSSK